MLNHMLIVHLDRDFTTGVRELDAVERNHLRVLFVTHTKKKKKIKVGTYVH